MKTLAIILLLALGMKAQTFDKKWHKYDDAIDFWSTFAVSELSYGTMTIFQKNTDDHFNQECRKIFGTIGLTFAYCTVSQKLEYGYWFPHKGMGMDMLTKLWSIPIWTLQRIVRTDVKKNRLISIEYKKHLLD